jgi:hypothetical protein
MAEMEPKVGAETGYKHGIKLKNVSTTVGKSSRKATDYRSDTFVALERKKR